MGLIEKQKAVTKRMLAEHLQATNVERDAVVCEKIITELFDKIASLVMDEGRTVTIYGIGSFFPRTNISGNRGNTFGMVVPGVETTVLAFKRSKKVEVKR
ncbi:MAG: hypothetical protein ACXWT0_03765 [Methylobacter sp.]